MFWRKDALFEPRQLCLRYSQRREAPSEACRGRSSGRQAATALWYEGVSELFGATHAAPRYGGGLRCRKAELAVAGPAKARRHTSANTTYSISPTALTRNQKGLTPIQPLSVKTIWKLWLLFYFYLPNLSTYNLCIGSHDMLYYRKIWFTKILSKPVTHNLSIMLTH